MSWYANHTCLLISFSFENSFSTGSQKIGTFYSIGKFSENLNVFHFVSLLEIGGYNAHLAGFKQFSDDLIVIDCECCRKEYSSTIAICIVCEFSVLCCTLSPNLPLYVEMLSAHANCLRYTRWTIVWPPRTIVCLHQLNFVLTDWACARKTRCFIVQGCWPEEFVISSA